MTVRQRTVSIWFVLTVLATNVIFQHAEAADTNLNLMVDTGGHTAQVNNILFTPDGSQLVSVSDDKTIRVWNVETGKAVRTIRGEIGQHRSGQVYALAVSSNSRFLAVAGWFGTGKQKPCCGDIRLYDFQSGKILALLHGHKNIVLDLDFSPDGQYLISASQDKTAIVWNMSSQSMVLQVDHGAHLYAAKFVDDRHRIVTSGVGNTIKLWNGKTGDLIQELKGHTDKVYSLAVNKDGIVASGDLSGAIKLWNGRNGRFIRNLGRQSTEVAKLAFDSSGQHLISGSSGFGRHHTPNIWHVPTNTKLLSYEQHDNTVRAVAINPVRSIAASAGGNKNEIHIWNLQSGRRLKDRDGEKLLLGGVGNTIKSVAVSKKSGYIAWGSQAEFVNANNRGPLSYKLRLPTKQQSMGEPEKFDKSDLKNFQRAIDQYQEKKLARQRGGRWNYFSTLIIKKSNKIIGINKRGLLDGYRHTAFSFSSNGQQILTGGSHGVLEKINLQGKKYGRFLGHSGVVWALAIFPDDRLVITGSHDQTLKLWNWRTQELIISIFHSPNGEWIAWTPQGYYTSSPNGDKFVGWQINRGADKAADYFTARQLKKHLYSPEIINRAILHASAKKAIKELRPSDTRLAELLSHGAPNFTISSDGSPLGGDGKANIALFFKNKKYETKRVEVYVNDINVTPITSRGFIPVKKKKDGRTISVPLMHGMNKILIRVSNDWGTSEQTLLLESRSSTGSLNKKGTLYLISIGVDKYLELNGKDLQFAGADAKAFTSIVTKKTSALFTTTKSFVLTHEQGKEPTAANIRRVLRILRKAKETDTVILFMAGHGVRDGEGYLFLPTDSRRVGEDWDFDTIIEWQTIENAFRRTKGRRILFVDTCHSGDAYNARLSKDTADAGIFALSATDADTLAEEVAELGHGVFTYSVNKGLNGEADLYKDGKISLFELATFVSNKVVELTDGRQRPAINARTMIDFTMAYR